MLLLLEMNIKQYTGNNLAITKDTPSHHRVHAQGPGSLLAVDVVLDNDTGALLDQRLYTGGLGLCHLLHNCAHAPVSVGMVHDRHQRIIYQKCHAARIGVEPGLAAPFTHVGVGIQPPAPATKVSIIAKKAGDAVIDTATLVSTTKLTTARWKFSVAARIAPGCAYTEQGFGSGTLNMAPEPTSPSTCGDRIPGGAARAVAEADVLGGSEAGRDAYKPGWLDREVVLFWRRLPALQ
jgi:hypothetical protein